MACARNDVAVELFFLPCASIVVAFFIDIFQVKLFLCCQQNEQSVS